jgi:uncharacterized protein YegP (UPF0339 family)
MKSVTGRDDELAEIDLTEDEIDAMMAAGEEAEVIPPPGVAQPFIVLYVDEFNLYGWRLCSASGEVLASSRLYPTKAAATGAARAMIQASAHATLLDRTAS